MPSNMELIKINTDYYIIVDDSKIKIDDFYIDDSNTVRCAITEVESYWTHRKHYKKVTHSTKPLEDVTVLVRPDGSDVSETIFDKVKGISLPEVKKITGEVDMEELELKYHQQLIQRREVAKNFRGQVAGNHPDMFTSREMLSMMEGFTDGYTQALDDNKDKKYTDDDVIAIVKKSRETGLSAEYIIISDYQPKSHWEVEFVDGKLKLK